MRLLLSKGQEKNMPFVKQLLVNFVQESRNLYGDSFVSFNVHSMIHLPEDYLKWGELDSVSCFPFESFLGIHIKGCLKGRYKPLEQISKHIAATNQASIPKPVQGIVMGKRCKESTEVSYKSLKLGTTILKKGFVGDRDNCVLLASGEIGIIKMIKEKNVSIQTFKNKLSFFTFPINSSQIGIYKVYETDDCLKTVSIKYIHSKIMLIPKQNYFVAIKMLHRLNE
jgi:hypothetical protein